MSTWRMAWLAVQERRRRVVGLVAFAGLFLLAGLAARLLVADAHGHVDADQLFAVGGYPLVSGLLLMGWLLGRFPILATLVLLSGVVSHDRDAGFARIYSVRPASPLRLYAARAGALAAVAFLICAVLMPAFDLLMIGTWAGPATLVLILANVIAFTGLTLLLSVWVRGDAWIALLLFVAALVWNGLRSADAIPLAPGVRDFVSFLLPPHPAMLQLEDTFGALQPIPWAAFLYIVGYGLFMAALASVSIGRREI